MPVVELDYARLCRLAGTRSRKKIADALPYLGLDIEGVIKGGVKVEYSPNRPDYSTDYGIANGLQGIMGLKRGMIRQRLKNSGYSLRADPAVSPIRPFVSAVAARNGVIDSHALGQLIAMQEDLHSGIGRGRKKSSMGIHDMDKISFPVRYTVADKSHRFVPLGSETEQPVGEILAGSKVGREYGHILGDSGLVPLIVDSDGSTVSLPPIINAASTRVTTNTTNLLVEVTGTGRDDVEDALSVTAMILQSAGFEMHAVNISGAKNSTPQLKPRRVAIGADLVRDTLGLDLSAGQIATALRKCRLDASVSGKSVRCMVPRYRFDIFGSMDLVEEVALGYGIQNILPARLLPQAPGRRHRPSVLLDGIASVMTKLGYMEALNSGLTSRRLLYESTMRDPAKNITVADSKSSEHTVLRDSLLPGLLGNLAKNIHEQYPQKLFETGTVFGRARSITEETRLCAASSHGGASYSEAKSVLQALAGSIYGMTCTTRAADYPVFEKGRAALVLLDERPVGVIGEVDSSVRANFKLREPASCFEITVSA